MYKLDEVVPLLTEVKRLGHDRLIAACPCPEHQGPGRLKFGIRKDGRLTFLCEAGCDPQVIAGAIVGRAGVPGDPVPPSPEATMPEVDTTIPGGQPNRLPRCDLDQQSPIDPKEAIQAIRQRKRGRGRSSPHEIAVAIAKVIREEFMRTQIRIIFTKNRSFALADGEIMRLDPGDATLQRFLQGRFGVLADHHDVRTAIAILADQIPSGELPVPLRAANYLDLQRGVFYAPARDKVVTVNLQGEVGSTLNGREVLFLPKADCGNWRVPEEIPAFEKVADLLHCCRFADRPGASYADQWAACLGWLLAALLQAAVRPVPTLVVAGDPETALAVAETLGSLVARTGLQANSPASPSRVEDLFGSGPAVILDYRHRPHLPPWLRDVLLGAPAGFNGRTKEPLSPEAPVASTYPIVLPRGACADAANLPPESVIITVGEGGADAVREAAECGSPLYWELLGVVREVLPALLRDGGGQPIPFDRFVGIVHRVMGGDPVLAPDLKRLRSRPQRAPNSQVNDQILAGIQFWLRDARNVGRVLLVRDLLPELQAVSKHFGVIFPCTSTLSLAQRLRQMKPQLIERLGFSRKPGRSGFVKVGFRKAG